MGNVCNCRDGPETAQPHFQQRVKGTLTHYAGHGCESRRSNVLIPTLPLHKLNIGDSPSLSESEQPPVITPPLINEFEEPMPWKCPDGHKIKLLSMPFERYSSGNVLDSGCDIYCHACEADLDATA